VVLSHGCHVTLHSSAEDLMGLFQRRHSAGSNGRGAVAEAEAEAEAEVAPAAEAEADSIEVETAPAVAAEADLTEVETAPTATDEADLTEVETAPTEAEEADSAEPATAGDVVADPAVATLPAEVAEQPVAQDVEDASSDVAGESTGSVSAPVPERPPFGLDEFPCLPLGAALWSDEIANVTNLSAVVPRMPNSLLVLTSAKARAAAVVTDGTIVDAVWVSAHEGLLGDDAAQALMKADEGTLTAYMSDDPRLAAVLPLLWRWPRIGPSLPTAWLHTDDLVAEMRTSRRTCALLVASADPGMALFNDGALVGAFTTAHPWPGKSIASLWNLLHTPGSRVTVIGDSGPAAAAEPTDDEPPAVTAPRRPSRATAARRAAAATAAAASATTPIVEEPTSVTVVEEPVAVTAVEEPTAAMPVEEPEATADHEAALDADAGVSTPELVADGIPQAVSDDLLIAEVTESDTKVDEPLIAAFGEHSDDAEAAMEPTDMERVEAREAGEFVAPRLDIDVDALRDELIGIAVTWLGADDAALVVSAIRSARGGVDDFVLTIAAIGAMDIPGHDRAVVRAMGREMHFRASEVLCGV
jgi:hypothetical protein